MADTYPETMQEAFLFSFRAILPASIFVGQLLLAALVLFATCTFPGLPRCDLGLAGFLTAVLSFLSFFYEIFAVRELTYSGRSPGLGRVAMVAFVRAYVLTVVLVLVIRIAEFLGSFLPPGKKETAPPARKVEAEKKDA